MTARSAPARGVLTVALALLTLIPLARPLAAQLREARPGDVVEITPLRRYDAGFIHRWFLGDLRRELWATPVRVTVLDLDTFASGLTPVERGGGQQTRSLRLRGADGRLWTFRVVDKDASRTLDPELRRSIAARVLQDQIGALLPVGALVVAPLLEAAGVLHAAPMLTVLPADPRLGEFEAEFAGILGFIEERPADGPDGEPGFAGSADIVSSRDLFDRIEEHARNRVDTEAFLRARLIDVFVGDWDRHPDQWRWAAFEEGAHVRWAPIPRDRDWAFARLDGLLPRAAAYVFPNYVGFDDEYPSAFAATWAGRALDRRLLAGVARADWERVAADLAARLDDATLEQAVRALPPSYFEQVGEDLLAALRRRRDGLTEMADEFYELLAGWVDLETTDEAELAEIERIDERFVRVTVSLAEGGPPFVDRTFDARETHEVRIDLHGGPDRVFVRGAPGGDVRIRVMGGGGADSFVDQTAGGRVHFYDSRGDNRVTRGGATTFDDSDWAEPLDVSSQTHQARARDWGSYSVPAPSISGEPDLGLYVGIGVIRWGYGFRHYPWRTRLSASLGYGTTTGRIRADVAYDVPLIGDIRARFGAGWSGIERTRFHGFGNETVEREDRAFHQADRHVFSLSAEATLEPAPGIEIGAGPVLRRIRHDDNEGTLLDSVAPYGSGAIDLVGLHGRIHWDRRDRCIASSRGTFVALDVRYFPAMLDVEHGFGGLRAEASTYWTPLRERATLAFRLGGEKVWGDPPYFEAAALGASSTIRGFSRQRFIGDASAFGNAELRLRATDFFVMLPGSIGLLGLADAGRVFAHGESSNRWHSAAGGGIWLSFLGPANTFSIAVARSEERIGLYARAGYHF
ncbi:MAG: hypothetical protein L0271_21355 [Gemmatimonadetes bacterium]|nr:hypothetical protein [Gemmatimonadota bacterium]